MAEQPAALRRVLGHPQHRGDGVKGKNLGRGAVTGAFRIYFTAVFNNQNDQSLQRGKKTLHLPEGGLPILAPLQVLKKAHVPR